MIWYLIYFGIALVFYLILWINLIKKGELLEKKPFKISTIIILIPFFVVFIWKTSEFTIQPIFAYLYKPENIIKVNLENNSKKINEYVFFARRANMEHWKPIYTRNNFSLDLDAFSAIEKLLPNQIAEFEFSPTKGKYDRILIVKLEEKMDFKAGKMQAVAINISTIPVKFYSSDFDTNTVKTIKPNLNNQIFMISMFLVATIGFLYHIFIGFERLLFRIIFILINFVLALLSGYFVYIFAKYLMLYI